MSLSKRIVVFTRFPVAGKAKTRLIPTLGAEGAAELQRDMSGRALLTARVAATQCGADVKVQYTGGSPRQMEGWLGRGTPYAPPTSSDLGASMLAGFEDAAAEGCDAILTIGSDCPELTADMLEGAFDALAYNDLVIGPAADGGYYLIGMRCPHPALFKDITWGEHEVLKDTLKAAADAHLSLHLLAELSDVDQAADLPAWQRTRVPEPTASSPVRLSVIIPALNEASSIEATLQAAKGQAHEIIVVDGGSQDDTVARARAAGATTVLERRGTRGQLLNIGALHASGEVLLFLHADTCLPEHYAKPIQDALLRRHVSAGAFAFAVAHPAARFRILETFTNLRSRLLRLPYGDQGLFMSRARFHRLGGFADLPIMEDFELVRRLRRHGKVVTLGISALTSDRRWRKLGLLKTLCTNQRVIIHYYLRRPPNDWVKLYDRAKGVQAP